VQGKNMSFERRSRIRRTLLVVASVLVVLAAVQALVFESTAGPIPKPRLCVVGPDGETSGCGPSFPNPTCPGRGTCYPVGCDNGGCTFQCFCDER